MTYRPDTDAAGTLTTAEKAGQVLMTAFPGTTEAEFAAALGRRGPEAADWEVPPGGVIVFRANIPGAKAAAHPAHPAPAATGAPGAAAARLASLIAALDRRARAEPPGLGLLVGIDQEGGRVARLGPAEGFTEFPGNMALGALRDDGAGEAVGKAAAGATAETAAAVARAAARAMARELARVGVNVNMAPVLDVNCNPLNPVIGERSFGEDPERVASLGEAACLGFLEGGVIPVGKHFPGHGDTDLDSHLDLPRVPHSLERLRAVELVPFARAIRAGLPAVMTAHVSFPAVEGRDLPATLSAPVLGGLLRRELGFDGVVIADALEMRALAARYSVGEAAVLSLAAGADLLLVCRPGLAGQARRAIVEAVRAGRLPAARLDEAVGRVLALKARVGALAGPGRDSGQDSSHAPSEAEHRRLAASIAARAVTLVRDDAGVLPLDPAAPGRWLVAAPEDARGLAEGLAHFLARHHAGTVVAASRAMASGASAIIVATQLTGGVTPQGAPPPGSPAARAAALVGALLGAGPPVVWVSVGTPYDLALVPQAPTFLAAYSSSGSSLEAVAAVIAGRARPLGRLPVSIPGLYPAGHGL